MAKARETGRFQRLDPFGNTSVGVYLRTTSTHSFLPPGLTEREKELVQETLGGILVETTVGGSPIVGSLMAANANGAVVADFASDEELQAIAATGLDVMRLEHSRLNAAGNNILCNDHGAIAHTDLADATVEAVSDVLQVPVERAKLAGVATVGTAAAATNHGVLAHPLASDDELNFLKRALHAPARIGTVNHGHGLVGAGIAANQNGAVCGSRTTGIELGRIEEALGYLE